LFFYWKMLTWPGLTWFGRKIWHEHMHQSTMQYTCQGWVTTKFLMGFELQCWSIHKSSKTRIVSQGFVFGHHLLLASLEICATDCRLWLAQPNNIQRTSTWTKDSFRSDLAVWVALIMRRCWCCFLDRTGSFVTGLVFKIDSDYMLGKAWSRRIPCGHAPVSVPRQPPCFSCSQSAF
jgi:hypothetical protein